MASKENEILLKAIVDISKQYGKAYSILISKIPDMMEKYYSEDEGFFDVQEIINQTLQPINEFSQIAIYDEFYNSSYTETMRQNSVKYNFNYNFSQVDTKSLEVFKSPQNWLVSKYQTLTDQGKTLNKMEELWKSGESVEKASKELDVIFQKSNSRVNAHTQNTIVTNNTKVRTIADLNNYSQNRITKYRYNAVLDKVTTETCRDLDGKIYNVADAKKFQDKIDKDVNDIIRKGAEKNTPDWKIYNKTMEYLQDNDSFALETGTKKRPWQSQVIFRTSNPQVQGKKRVKSYKDLDSVPGNKLPRPPVHNHCRSEIDPEF